LKELYADSVSPIHGMDARVKVIFTLAFLIFLSLTPSNAWPAYILFLTCVVAISMISRVGIGFVLKRAFIAFPFVLAAFPLIFTGPAPHQNTDFLFRIHLVYSPAGLGRFVSIALKSWISVQGAILLAATTRFPDLLVALQKLKTPKLFIAIIGLMWRYLFVISEEAGRLLRARASRSGTNGVNVHTGGGLTWRARVTGGMAGNLFLRSLERSDRVYAAMLSRGYTGELPVSEAAPFMKSDQWILAIGLSVMLLIWLLGLLTGG
jgi:cobalt/nickel transport system permease protein